MLAFLLFVVLWTLPGLADVDDTGYKWCNGQQYNETRYTCFDGLLCPVLWGFPSSRCGDGCYSPLYYNCSDNQLSRLLPEAKPFKLLAYNPEKIVVGSVEACGQEFRVKEGGACSYCPPQVGNSCPPGKETVLLPGAGMHTLVPGGQRYYINNFDGHLSFTLPHSSVAVNATFGALTALDGGAFYTGGVEGGFVTCPSQEYKIYVKLTDVDAPKFPDDCFNIQILTVPWNGTGPAAWEYI